MMEQSLSASSGKGFAQLAYQTFTVYLRDHPYDGSLCML